MDTKDFYLMARKLIVSYVNIQPDSHYIKLNDVVVVWSCKTLQNHKAMFCSTKDGDERYYEVTYNGDKQEMYFDCYDKVENIVYPVDRLLLTDLRKWGVFNE